MAHKTRKIEVPYPSLTSEKVIQVIASVLNDRKRLGSANPSQVLLSELDMFELTLRIAERVEEELPGYIYDAIWDQLIKDKVGS